MKGLALLPAIFISEKALLPNGWRYPRVGGTRQRHFAGTNFQPRKLLENAATPTRRVHAVLGGFCHRRRFQSIRMKMRVRRSPFHLVVKPCCLSILTI